MTGEGTRRPGRLRGLALAALVALSGCSGGDEVAPVGLQLLQAGRAAVNQRTAGPEAPRPALTRAALDTVTVSAIEVTLERADVLAYLLLLQERRDDSPGVIRVWRSEDNLNLVTRSGVLIATRGLGGDVLSAAVQVATGRPGPASGGDHVQVVRAFDNKSARLAFSCELVDLGPDPVVIVETRHPTRHLQQRCSSDLGEIVNDFWVDSARDIVWQSRQWAGPQIGYVRIRRLTVR